MPILHRGVVPISGSAEMTQISGLKVINGKLDESQVDAISRSGLFNYVWYKEKYLSSDLSSSECFEHFIFFGIQNNYSPGPEFDVKYYLSSNPDLKKGELCPLLHYIAFGKSEGRFANEGEEWKDGLVLTKDALENLADRYGHEFGDHSYGKPRIIGSQFAKLSIGKFCSIGQDVDIVLANHRMNLVSTYPFNMFSARWPTASGSRPDHVARGNVVIGNDVWIGAKAVILTGVQIADGAVVGAASVVRTNVPPYAIVAGAPAKIVGFRFPAEIVEQLLRIRWWDWPDRRLADMLPLMLQDNIQTFINLCGEG